MNYRNGDKKTEQKVNWSNLTENWDYHHSRCNSSANDSEKLYLNIFSIQILIYIILFRRPLLTCDSTYPCLFFSLYTSFLPTSPMLLGLLPTLSTAFLQFLYSKFYEEDRTQQSPFSKEKYYRSRFSCHNTSQITGPAFQHVPDSSFKKLWFN